MKKPTKAHIICHLLATQGPMTRVQLLQATAQIEGKPYKPASNNSYFQPHGNLMGHDRRLYGADKHSLVANGSIQVVGKQGNTLLYANTVKGASKAAEYQDWLAAAA